MVIKREAHAGPKNQAVGRPTEMKHPDLITFPDMLAFIGRDLARRYLGHAHAQETHQADIRVISFDEDNGPRRNRRDITLRIVRTGRIKPLRGCLRIVASVLYVRFDHPAIYRAVPAVITEGAQVGLVDCSADE